MNKMLIVNFTTEADAYRGLDVLKELDEKADITLYATAVVTKDSEGKLSIKQAADNGPIGTAVGMFTGALLGLVGGAPAAALGATAGGFTGAALDLTNVGIEVDFLDEVAKALTPGKVAVVAEIDEEWDAPINSRMAELGGEVLRSTRYQYFEDQLTEESKQEIAAKSPSNKLESIKTKAERKLNHIKHESEAKITKLQGQMKQVSTEQKAKVEARITAIKEDQQQRNQKLQKIKESVQEIIKS